ncbi:MAG: tRNA pseudouridine(38-40) synthase TruA [Propionibacteriaceae bacterium]|jgi:tRNA pseudouridine38-40 synthase|nr:tRNA pseudouridine(38-40) synthase TruA [Propionibacteriaceae bacterium]
MAETRLRLDIAYDGAGFSGWATQPGRRTVQDTVEQALAQILRLPEPPRVFCAGRTDAGVHARGQVAHTDLPENTPTHRGATLDTIDAVGGWLPRVLPDDIVLRRAAIAPAGFDARFSALRRHYCYRLWDDPYAVDPLTRSFTALALAPLDVEAMAAAAERLLGLHDFAAFCRPKEGGTTIRTLLRLEPVRRPDGLIEIAVSADAFGHSMVRSLVGALTAIGRGRRDASWLAGLLALGRRAHDVQVMPARGLTLERVDYPPDSALAARAEETKTVRVLPEADPAAPPQPEASEGES